ncbi:MAG: sugar phosphate nucleotidyltransferase [Candidatus Babeliales bacterium]
MGGEAVYCFILAGGQGTRLWPLSNERCPKQFMRYGFQETLLEQTIKRAALVVKPEHIFISTIETYRDQVEPMVLRYGCQLFIEPLRKNTAAAILFFCTYLSSFDPDSIVLIMPSDAYIHDEHQNLFAQTIRGMIDCAGAHKGAGVLCGLKPLYPCPEYGYIIGEQGVDCTKKLHSVQRFHEKPEYKVAQNYQENFSFVWWNSGMFCVATSPFVEQCMRINKPFMDVIRAAQTKREAYETLPSQPLERLFLPEYKPLYVQSAFFHWIDIGTIERFFEMYQARPQKERDQCIEMNASDNLIIGNEKLVVFLNVHNLQVIHTDELIVIMGPDGMKELPKVMPYCKKQEASEFL